ncbi:ALDH-like protein [Hesseltinella vesiculosa]|uniref:ALDH-like protein n=1 Tax=Hesseltinella vesiculosa TaxID=101127 RepID=A0A1X2GDL3_9FUNG|nr:ALDH-like protein [Hesseltinella vesiculosa]
MTEVAKCLRFFAGYADKPMGLSHIDQGMHMTTSREPIGVCGLITSYNYPLMLTGWKLGPSLAAGNSVLIKPAPQTPLTSLALAELASNIIPVDNLLQVLPGSVDTGRAIVELVDKTSFTGSTPGGQAIMRQAADLLQPLTLECGGKNTVIVDADADLEKAVAAIGQGAFSNTGQNCCAVSRVLAHVDIHDKLVALLQEETKQWQPYTETSPPTADASSRFYGPLIDKQQVDRVLTYIIPSRIAFQASLPASLAHYIPPTVYLNVPDEARLSQEEIFGPVLSVLRPFASLEEAIARANDTRFGLAGGVFSGNYANAHRITSQLKAGIVWVNTYNWIPPAAPFGGTKLSGIGKDLGRDALNEFTFTKTTLHSIE